MNINTSGIITKKEKLALFESVVKFNELVLEDKSPFPGYYDLFHIPQGERETLPKFLFLIVKSFDHFREDDFVRLTQRIKGDYDFDFDARAGRLYLYNELASCIRLRIENITFIPEIIQKYSEAGIIFAKKRMVKPFESIIKIKKHFILEGVEEGIYRHPEKKAVHYIQVPRYIDWDSFEHATLFIRRNSDYKHFDAAQASLFHKNTMIELVRIYDRNCTIDNLRYLKDKYTQEIERSVQQ